jgi:hypothetical protein
MKTSNPPSYDNIFSIKMGATQSVTSGATIPNHRALLIITTTTPTFGAITFTNMDNTVVSMSFGVGTYILPMQIKSYTFGTSAGVFIYGLL